MVKRGIDAVWCGIGLYASDWLHGGFADAVVLDPNCRNVTCGGTGFSADGMDLRAWTR